MYLSWLFTQIGYWHINFGLETSLENPSGLIIYLSIGQAMILFYIYLNASLLNINMDQSSSLTQMIQVNRTAQFYKEILNSQDEGLIICKDNQIDFTNEVFVNMT